MRTFLLNIIIALFAATTFQALALDEGFYRVMNVGSSRHCFVWDNTGSLDYSKTDADLGAIELFKNNPPRFSDPGTVIYVKKVGSSYDFQSQGTGVYQIIQYYVSLSDRGNGAYWIYASAQGMTKYLCDEATSSRTDRGKMATAKSDTRPNFQLWSFTPVSANGDEYFGITPTVHANGRHFQPFYADFAFQYASSGMKTWYVKQVDETKGAVIINEYSGEAIARKTPIIIETTATESTSNRLSLLNSGGNSISDNKLKGNFFCNRYRLTSNNAKTEFNPQTMRVLGVNASGKLAYLNTPYNLEEINGAYYLAANQSYLQVSANAPSELLVMTQSEYDAAFPPIVNVSSITLSQTQASLHVGEGIQLTASVAPANATDRSVNWSTSNANVATVDEQGNVLAAGLGQATITVTANDGSGISASCTVTVEPTLVEEIVLSQTTATLRVGDEIQLSAIVMPDDATDGSVTWSSSNPAVATVDGEGNVSAISLGTAQIVVTAKDGSGVSASCSITVEATPVESIFLSHTQATLRVGGSLQITATVFPDDATDLSFTWSSSNPSVATVDINGLVTALTLGTAEITATANDGSGVSANCTITVEATPVESIEINGGVDSLLVGTTLQLSAVVLPVDATFPAFTWNTSDAAVATISTEGLVSALTPGEVTLTATVTNQPAILASVTIVVYKEPDPVIPDAIESPMSVRNADCPVFNLQGQRVLSNAKDFGSLPAGIYIINGKTIKK